MRMGCSDTMPTKRVALQQTAPLSSVSTCRYAFQEQPEIGHWNLVMLANALIGARLVGKAAAERALGAYCDALQKTYTAGIAKKMGLK